MTIRDYEVGPGNTNAVTWGGVQKLVLENDSGQLLDLTHSWEDQAIELTRARNNVVNVVPNRVDHDYGGGVDMPITFTFTVPTYSLNMDDVVRQAARIEQWFRESPGQRARKIHWVKDDAVGRSDYVPNCYWSSFAHSIAAGKRKREISNIAVTVQSTSSRWYTTLSEEYDEDVLTLHGSVRHWAQTNDGSAVRTVILESTGEPLAVATDQGDLFIKGALKTNRSAAFMADYA